MRVLLGGNWNNAVNCGSRYSNWNNAPSNVNTNIGGRGASDTFVKFALTQTAERRGLVIATKYKTGRCPVLVMEVKAQDIIKYEKIR